MPRLGNQNDENRELGHRDCNSDAHNPQKCLPAWESFGDRLGPEDRMRFDFTGIWILVVFHGSHHDPKKSFVEEFCDISVTSLFLTYADLIYGHPPLG